jgi:hypothetical protein
MKRLRLLLPLLAAMAGCATEKIAASEVFAPELTVHTLPEGAEVFRGGRSLGIAPLNLPVPKDATSLELEARRDGFLPAKLSVDVAGLRQHGGGETWLALKVTSMGTETPELDGLNPADLDRGGLALTKAKRCDDAQQFFTRALALDPRFARAHRDRARCLAMTKQNDKAATELELYLTTLADDAPDAEAVRGEIDKLRRHRDIDLGATPASRTN